MEIEEIAMEKKKEERVYSEGLRVSRRRSGCRSDCQRRRVKLEVGGAKESMAEEVGCLLALG